MRDPVVSGQFYPAEPSKLKDALSQLIPPAKYKEKVKGIILPHAGYIYSGGVTGETISKIRIPDSVIMLGPNHTGFGIQFSLMPRSSWNTPLGEILIDEEISEALLKNSQYLKSDRAAHLYEHSLEVQLPFFQYIKSDFKFVPIILGETSFDVLQKIADEMAQVIRISGRDILLVASTDMTHYESQKIAADKDKKAIDAILEMDPEKLFNTVKKHNITMCGYIPVAVMLIALKSAGASAAKLVKYRTSGDASGDYSSVVGYAGFTIT